MLKIWKIIKKSNYKSVKHCVNDLKRKKVYVSPWIENIVNNKKTNFR